MASFSPKIHSDIFQHVINKAESLVQSKLKIEDFYHISFREFIPAIVLITQLEIYQHQYQTNYVYKESFQTILESNVKRLEDNITILRTINGYKDGKHLCHEINQKNVKCIRCEMEAIYTWSNGMINTWKDYKIRNNNNGHSLDTILYHEEFVACLLSSSYAYDPLLQKLNPILTTIEGRINFWAKLKYKGLHRCFISKSTDCLNIILNARNN